MDYYPLTSTELISEWKCEFKLKRVAIESVRNYVVKCNI